MKRESINPTDWGRKWSFDQAELVQDARRYLVCSGQISVRPDPDSELGVSIVSPQDIRGQIEAVLANLDAVLRQGGMTRQNLINLRFYTTDVDGFLANYDVYAQWIGAAEIRPPQTLLGVQRLAFPELKIEIEAVAAD